VFPRSTLKTETPSARENPVPLTFQLRSSKALATCRPRRPVAPVTTTFLPAMSGNAKRPLMCFVK
ncbi:hypothetical protein CH063_01779, partial [Colletotrichum higginsianum]